VSFCPIETIFGAFESLERALAIFQKNFYLARGPRARNFYELSKIGKIS